MPGMGNENSDLDPQLLRESGRASAIQDLADQASAMGDRAKALEHATQRALNEQVKRWKRTSILLGVGIVLLMVIGGINLGTNQSNRAILDDVHKLVEFVEEVERDNAEPNPLLQKALQSAIEAREIVCRSSDPGMQEACAELDQG